MPEMKCFERASPVLREILFKLYRAASPIAVDHQWYEFGSVEYHIQMNFTSDSWLYIETRLVLLLARLQLLLLTFKNRLHGFLASQNLKRLLAPTNFFPGFNYSSVPDTKIIHLSISTPLLCNKLLSTNELVCSTKEMKKAIGSNVVEIIEPARDGFQLTLRLDMAKLPGGKGGLKMITEISSVQATILSSQLKQILWNVNSDASGGICKPIKLIYHPGEPFFVVKQPGKITAVFPMRFEEESDVMIATSFFQELMDVGSLKAYSKAPSCTWTPIPPPELRGEHFDDLSTNGGFITFDISSNHIKGRRMDKTVWCLLNFYALVKYHVKCTRGFIQRRMRSRLESLVKVLHNDIPEETQDVEQIHGCGCMKQLMRIPVSPKMKRGCGFTSKVKRISSKIKIRWFRRFRRLSSAMKYTKLE